jgi:hypothetical protein
MSESNDPDTLAFGQAVYDDDGTRLGTIRGFDEHGFHVSTDDGIEALSSEHIASGLGGEAQLMWQCYECGAMGDIEAIPDMCPDCGASKESIFYYVDD